MYFEEKKKNHKWQFKAICKKKRKKEKEKTDTGTNVRRKNIHYMLQQFLKKAF